MVFEFTAPVKVHVTIKRGKLVADIATVDIQGINDASFQYAYDLEAVDQHLFISEVATELSDLLYAQGKTPPIRWEGYPIHPDFMER